VRSIEFGNKLLSNFVNSSPELEVYDALKRAGCFPDRNVVPEGKTGKNLDFKSARMEGMSSSRESITGPGLLAET